MPEEQFLAEGLTIETINMDEEGRVIVTDPVLAEQFLAMAERSGTTRGRPTTTNSSGCTSNASNCTVHVNTVSSCGGAVQPRPPTTGK